MMTKDMIRIQAKAARSALPEGARDELSASVARRLYELDAYAQSAAVAVYASVGSEVNTRPVITHALSCGKKVFCPKVTDAASAAMEFYEIASPRDLTPSAGRMSIPEPAGDSRSLKSYLADPDIPRTVQKDMPHLIFLVPGLAFNLKGARIGYGGGFYDTYLSGLISAAGDIGDGYLIALAFDCQVLEEDFPVEAHDVRMQRIVTETRCIPCYNHSDASA